MGKFVPLVGSLRGKIGAMVIDKGGRVRMHAPGPNRTPTGVKNAFTVLAKSWPFSSVEYKSLVENAPGSSRGIGYLTGQAHRAYALAPLAAAEEQVDGRGILPYRLSNLPGEFGELQTLSPFTLSAEWATDNLKVNFAFTTLPTVKAGTWKVALAVFAGDLLLTGEILPDIAGAVCLAGTPASTTVSATDTRYTDGALVRNITYFAAIYATDPTTDEPVVHGFGSGCIMGTA